MRTTGNRQLVHSLRFCHPFSGILLGSSRRPVVPLLKLLNRVLGRDGRDAYYAAIQLAGK